VPVESDVIGPGGKKAVAALATGGILMMENLRFYPEEEANDLAFAKSLAALGDLYVGDAFSCAHRAHASVDALPRLMPSAAGRSFAAELEALNAALSSPVRPTWCRLLAVQKFRQSWPCWKILLPRLMGLCLVGGWLIHFCWRRESQSVPRLPNLTWWIRRAGLWMLPAAHNCQILLPQDVVVAVEFKLGAAHRLVSSDDVADGEMILDAGAESVAAATAFLDRCSDNCLERANGRV
jgi:phosphoglycerate kinase